MQDMQPYLWYKKHLFKECIAYIFLLLASFLV